MMKMRLRLRHWLRHRHTHRHRQITQRALDKRKNQSLANCIRNSALEKRFSSLRFSSRRLLLFSMCFFATAIRVHNAVLCSCLGCRPAVQTRRRRTAARSSSPTSSSTAASPSTTRATTWSTRCTCQTRVRSSSLLFSFFLSSSPISCACAQYILFSNAASIFVLIHVRILLLTRTCT